MRLFILLLLLFAFDNACAATNEIIVKEYDGANKTNYPVVLGRVFKRGEIANYPVAVYSGSNIATQANVKKRWDDGSVKHAIISFLIDLSAGQSKTISFANQASGNTTPLPKNDMLAAGYDFEAKISVNFGGGNVDTSARTMLNADKYASFAPGSVANQIVIADHSTSRAYDFGSDANKSLRPIFIATFYPTINKVKVRFISENASTEVMQDQAYSVQLYTGNASPTSRYSKNTFTHKGGTRWTKEYWIGGDPGNISIDYNVAYLKETNQVYNFSSNINITESIISSNYSDWTAAAKDINDVGLMQKDGGTAGLRPEIGPYPRWHTLWLISGDYRLKQIATGNSDLAAAWRVHHREGDATKHLDRAGTVPGVGRIMSISERPTLALSQGYSYSGTASGDRVTTVGTVTTDGWVAECSHQGEWYSLPYMLTGDFWYLEQGLFYAAFNAAYPDGSATGGNWGRGPTGAEGGINDQVRGEAWTLRQRVNMAAITPDDMPELALLENWINEAIAIEEGRLNITSTSNNGTTLWTWGRNIKEGGLSLPPLHQWWRGNSSFVQAGYGINTSVVATASSGFEQDYQMIALGRAVQLGYTQAKPLADYLAHYYADAAVAGYNKYLHTNGRIPTTKTNSQYFASYSELETGYDCNVADCDTYTIDTGSYWGYPFVMRAAVSFVSNASVTGATTPYNTIDADLWALTGSSVSVNPQWYITPYTPTTISQGTRYRIRIQE